MLALALIALPAGALELRWPEGTLRGFPAVRDLGGRLLADASLAQWIENGDLRVKAVYEFRDGRRVEEQAVLRQQPELVQLRWSRVEQRGEYLLRRFDVDFQTRSATAVKREDGELQRWEESLELDAGKTFAGIGFMYAVKNLSDRLEKGERVQLTAVAFTPKPRTSTVTVSREAVETLHLGGRSFEANRFAIHPEIPAVARPFVKAPDQHLWFYRTPPPALLRAEGSLAEPGDPIVRLDILPGTSAAESRRPPRSARRSNAAASPR